MVIQELWYSNVVESQKGTSIHSNSNEGFMQRKAISLITKVIFLLSLMLMIGLFPISTHAQSSGPIYVVQQGDTLYIIAQRFGTTVEAIAAVNNITDPSVIVPGSELIIPGYEGVSGILEFHEVQFGETVRSMGSRFGVPEDALVKLNRLLHPGRIYLGQALIVSVATDNEQHLGKILLAESGESKLAFAARTGKSAWQLKDASSSLDRAWILPNERLYLPGEDEILNDLPAPLWSVEVTPPRVLQGNTLIVSIHTNGMNPVKGRFAETPLSFQSYAPEQIVALQGILALVEPGMYDLEIQVLDEDGGNELFSFCQPIRVASGQYYYDPVLYVPEETIDPEKTGAENELIASLVRQVSEEKYWEGVLQFPTSYTDSFPSYFGSRRNYNDQGYNWYHSGLDLYGGTSTPISAPANGRVVFAGFLDVRGNTTFIDHGWGVFTGYLHQSSIEVEEGDWVETGQLIGYVGATGRVTGPHLHWEVWVGGVPVDPLEWTSKVFP
jgi:murein DD-endopeptidase MepM/ murein hydrolase activator NlpD